MYKIVHFETREMEVYVLKTEGIQAVLIGSLMVVLFFLVITSLISIYLYRNPKYIERVRYTAANAKRSMSNKI